MGTYTQSMSRLEVLVQSIGIKAMQKAVQYEDPDQEFIQEEGVDASYALPTGQRDCEELNIVKTLDFDECIEILNLANSIVERGCGEYKVLRAEAEVLKTAILSIKKITLSSAKRHAIRVACMLENFDKLEYRIQWAGFDTSNLAIIRVRKIYSQFGGMVGDDLEKKKRKAVKVNKYLLDNLQDIVRQERRETKVELQLLEDAFESKFSASYIDVIYDHSFNIRDVDNEKMYLAEDFAVLNDDSDEEIVKIGEFFDSETVFSNRLRDAAAEAGNRRVRDDSVNTKRGQHTSNFSDSKDGSSESDRKRKKHDSQESTRSIEMSGEEKCSHPHDRSQMFYSAVNSLRDSLKFIFGKLCDKDFCQFMCSGGGDSTFTSSLIVNIDDFISESWVHCEASSDYVVDEVIAGIIQDLCFSFRNSKPILFQPLKSGSMEPNLKHISLTNENLDLLFRIPSHYLFEQSKIESVLCILRRCGRLETTLFQSCFPQQFHSEHQFKLCDALNLWDSPDCLSLNILRLLEYFRRKANFLLSLMTSFDCHVDGSHRMGNVGFENLCRISLESILDQVIPVECCVDSLVSNCFEDVKELFQSNREDTTSWQVLMDLIQNKPTSIELIAVNCGMRKRSPIPLAFFFTYLAIQLVALKLGLRSSRASVGVSGKPWDYINRRFISVLGTSSFDFPNGFEDVLSSSHRLKKLNEVTFRTINPLPQCSKILGSPQDHAPFLCLHVWSVLGLHTIVVHIISTALQLRPRLSNWSIAERLLEPAINVEKFDGRIWLQQTRVLGLQMVTLFIIIWEDCDVGATLMLRATSLMVTDIADESMSSKLTPVTSQPSAIDSTDNISNLVEKAICDFNGRLSDIPGCIRNIQCIIHQLCAMIVGERSDSLFDVYFERKVLSCQHSLGFVVQCIVQFFQNILLHNAALLDSLDSNICARLIGAFAVDSRTKGVAQIFFANKNFVGALTMTLVGGVVQSFFKMDIFLDSSTKFDDLESRKLSFETNHLYQVVLNGPLHGNCLTKIEESSIVWLISLLMFQASLKQFESKQCYIPSLTYPLLDCLVCEDIRNRVKFSEFNSSFSVNSPSSDGRISIADEFLLCCCVCSGACFNNFLWILYQKFPLNISVQAMGFQLLSIFRPLLSTSVLCCQNWCKGSEVFYLGTKLLVLVSAMSRQVLESTAGDFGHFDSEMVGWVQHPHASVSTQSAPVFFCRDILPPAASVCGIDSFLDLITVEVSNESELYVKSSKAVSDISCGIVNFLVATLLNKLKHFSSTSAHVDLMRTLSMMDTISSIQRTWILSSICSNYLAAMLGVPEGILSRPRKVEIIQPVLNHFHCVWLQCCLLVNAQTGTSTQIFLSRFRDDLSAIGQMFLSADAQDLTIQACTVFTKISKQMKSKLIAGSSSSCETGDFNYFHDCFFSYLDCLRTESISFPDGFLMFGQSRLGIDLFASNALNLSAFALIRFPLYLMDSTSIIKNVYRSPLGYVDFWKYGNTCRLSREFFLLICMSPNSPFSSSEYKKLIELCFSEDGDIVASMQNFADEVLYPKQDVISFSHKFQRASILCSLPIFLCCFTATGISFANRQNHWLRLLNVFVAVWNFKVTRWLCDKSVMESLSILPQEFNSFDLDCENLNQPKWALRLLFAWSLGVVYSSTFSVELISSWKSLFEGKSHNADSLSLFRTLASVGGGFLCEFQRCNIRLLENLLAHANKMTRSQTKQQDRMIELRQYILLHNAPWQSCQTRSISCRIILTLMVQIQMRILAVVDASMFLSPPFGVDFTIMLIGCILCTQTVRCLFGEPVVLIEKDSSAENGPRTSLGSYIRSRMQLLLLVVSSPTFRQLAMNKFNDFGIRETRMSIFQCDFVQLIRVVSDLVISNHRQQPDSVSKRDFFTSSISKFRQYSSSLTSNLPVCFNETPGGFGSEPIYSDQSSSDMRCRRCFFCLGNDFREEYLIQELALSQRFSFLQPEDLFQVYNQSQLAISQTSCADTVSIRQLARIIQQSTSF